MTDQGHMESLMKEILGEIRKLWDTLMGLEMELVDQLEVGNSCLVCSCYHVMKR